MLDAKRCDATCFLRFKRRIVRFSTLRALFSRCFWYTGNDFVAAHTKKVVFFFFRANKPPRSCSELLGIRVLGMARTYKNEPASPRKQKKYAKIKKNTILYHNLLFLFIFVIFFNFFKFFFILFHNVTNTNFRFFWHSR